MELVGVEEQDWDIECVWLVDAVVDWEALMLSVLLCEKEIDNDPDTLWILSDWVTEFDNDLELLLDKVREKDFDDIDWDDVAVLVCVYENDGVCEPVTVPETLKVEEREKDCDPVDDTETDAEGVLE